MEIKTKFSIGETVYGFNDKHKLVEFKVAKILIAIDDDSIIVTYYPSDGRGGCDFYKSHEEAYCFKSKEEALNYVSGK